MPTEKFYLELSEDSGSAHKFYEVIVDGTSVQIRFGRIGTDGSQQSQTFASEEEARKFTAKKVKEKSSKGYEQAVMGVRQKRSVTRRQITSNPSNSKKAPVLWSFQSGSPAFGIYIDEKACWIGNEAGRVFMLSHEGELLMQYQLPDGVKCIVADNGWIYVGCDDGNVYDLTGKTPRLAYTIHERVDIYWLDINNGLLGVSDGNGNITVINYEDVEQWTKKGRGQSAWMIRCDEIGRVFYGDSAGVACYYGFDGTEVWYQKTDSVLFGWQEKETVYAGTSSRKVHAFSKKGEAGTVCSTDASVFSCATAENGKYVFAGDNYSSIYCFNEQAERLWKLGTGCGSAYSMQYFQGKIYIVTTNGVLACIDASEEAILNAQQGVVPAHKDIKAPAPVAVAQTTDLETIQQPANGIVLQCVKDGSKLRMKVVSQGYHADWFVQFPNNLRQEGALYVVDEIRESAQGGFYRAYGNIYRLLN